MKESLKIKDKLLGQKTKKDNFDFAPDVVENEIVYGDVPVIKKCKVDKNIKNSVQKIKSQIKKEEEKLGEINSGKNENMNIKTISEKKKEVKSKQKEKKDNKSKKMTSNKEVEINNDLKNINIGDNKVNSIPFVSENKSLLSQGTIFDEIVKKNTKSFPAKNNTSFFANLTFEDSSPVQKLSLIHI